MDFNFRKPTHLIALLGLLGSLGIFVISPLISVFFPTQIPSVYTPSMTSLQKEFLQFFLLFFQLFFVFVGMIFVPLLWYKLVNHLTLKEMFNRINLRLHKLDHALLWGVIATITAFALSVTIGLLYAFATGVNTETLSNIPDLQQLFSIPALYLLVIIQPFCEEFFFRGFLLEKITALTNTPVAIIATALLFGISHLSYTYAYTAYLAVILGVVFALVVIRTKNLYSSIFAHTVINITSLTLYFFGRSIGM
jgi:membrane protease YdiL (CAAX protease family)